MDSPEKKSEKISGQLQAQDFSKYGSFVRPKKNVIPQSRRPGAPKKPLLSEKNDKSEIDKNPSLHESQAVSLDEFLTEEKNKKKQNKALNEHQHSTTIKEEKERLKKEKEELKKKQKADKKAQALALKEEKKRTKVKNPIGRKLILIISLVIVVALGGVTYLVSYFVSQDVRISAEENNLVINSRTASDCENRITGVTSSIAMFMEMLKSAGDNDTEVKSVQSLFFDHNKEIVALYLSSDKKLLTNSPYIIANQIEEKSILDYFAQEGDSFKKAASGTYALLNASPFFNRPLLSIFIPFAIGSQEASVGVLYSTESMSESFASGSVNQSIFVNNDGDLLVHGDISLMLSGFNEKENPLVIEMQQSTQDNSQITYLDALNQEYIGAFRKLSLGNGAVITFVKTSIILEGVQATTRRNIYITIAILFIAIMIVYFFAKTLSVPLKQLTAVVNEINAGNFNTDLFALIKENGKDEIGVLSRSTKNEREILNTFTTLTNKGVTEAIIKKKIDFEPHLKDITIFFSDIRGFTAISDGFKNRFGGDSAGEIINFLNDYMSRMVMCIQLTGGTVDKFEGDAIMACWGVLRNESLEWESLDSSSVTRARKQYEHDKYVGEDALSAITCCIAMRYALMKYNKDAEAFTKAHEGEPLAQYKPHIKIGAGLNSGRATVGFLGSKHKMEFTSIGDAVNFASRAESSNKPCGTDILITEDTYALLAERFIKCEKNNYSILPENQEFEVIVEQIPVEFDVKGKGKQHFYGVVNMPNFDIEAFFKKGDPDFVVDLDCARSVGKNGPKNLMEVRSLLGIPVPDFEKVNLDAEENKIQVAAN